MAKFGNREEFEQAREIAKRARGTPRIAGRLLRRVVDFAVVDGDGRVTQELADMALTRLGVDKLGLDGADRRYLRLIAENYAGGPVGIETISAALSESRDALEEVIEPFLLQQGLIQRTPRGRMLAQKGWTQIGLPMPDAGRAEIGPGRRGLSLGHECRVDQRVDPLGYGGARVEIQHQNGTSLLAAMRDISAP